MDMQSVGKLLRLVMPNRTRQVFAGNAEEIRLGLIYTVQRVITEQFLEKNITATEMRDLAIMFLSLAEREK